MALSAVSFYTQWSLFILIHWRFRAYFLLALRYGTLAAIDFKIWKNMVQRITLVIAKSESVPYME